jgi:EAL domain-containing protein (putative c-di-GMP-specific phosphodiesterase class I)
MTTLSKDMGMTVVAEGVETVAERDCLLDLGCDLLQGFLFAKPGRAFPGVVW